MGGVPLPSDLSGEIEERLIRVDKSLFYIVSGALAFITDYQQYQETAALTTEEVREALGDMLWDYFHEGVTIMPIGAIQFFGLDAPPEKWLECNGDSVLQSAYPKLFAAIGENFGFAVGGNFVLPDLRYRPAVGVGTLSDDAAYSIALGAKQGQAEIALSTTELPAHTHTITDPGHVHPPLSPSTNFLTSGSGSNSAPAGSQLPLRSTTGSATTGITVNSAGAGAPFPILNPALGLLACIYAGE